MLPFEQQQLEESAQICTPRPPALPYHNTEHVLEVLYWKVMDAWPSVLLAPHDTRG